jgi:hypothetical protein
MKKRGRRTEAISFMGLYVPVTEEAPLCSRCLRRRNEVGARKRKGKR